MKAAYDLHIHSALSPCADNDMTPNNIVNMSILKGLDIIAVTDHNSCANVPAIIECAKDTSLIVVPGMEIETSEEIHVVCLFPNVENAAEMQRLVYKNLPNTKNKEDIFGEQLILDYNDNLICKENRLLLTATCISINEVFDLVNNRLDGIAIPAHIDRQANSIISSFGAIPQDINIKCVEVSKKNAEDVLKAYKDSLENINTIYSSDAHYLWNIHERENFIDIENLTIADVIRTLGANK